MISIEYDSNPQTYIQWYTVARITDMLARDAAARIDKQVDATREQVRTYGNDVIFALECWVAEELFKGGRKPAFSSNICEELTCGYGELSQYGDWQFPLYPAEDYIKGGCKYNG